MLVEENRHLLKEAANHKRMTHAQLETISKMETAIERLETRLEKSEALSDQLKHALRQKDETIMALTRENER